MNYKVSYKDPDHHLLDIEFSFDTLGKESVEVQLPAWRPGRYELGNFAKNILNWKVYSESGKALTNHKVSKDKWIIETSGSSRVKIQYSYYAAEINAGSSYIGSDQLYINPVNCFLYIPGREAESCELELSLPSDYKIACSLTQTAPNVLHAADFHELADSPLIASNTLKHYQFVFDGVEFNLWFQGECKPKHAKLVNDFFVFINEHFQMMREFPASEYHFLFQILPYKFYHGVEHLKSTVIALGPSYDLMKGDVYEDLLGVSSHELFHSWNIKAIRPIEMMPYNYAQENYSRLGYVCEGITTYYGDLFLFRSGVYTQKDYYKTFAENLQKHFDNYGRYNLSVADSSFDTWLDGYVPGTPNRKVSIYTEGALAAFIVDVKIRKATDNDFSLDDVMRELYQEFGKKGMGYSEADYQRTLEKISGIDLKEYFDKFINSPASLENELIESLNYLGLTFESKPSNKTYEAFLGIKGIDDKGKFQVTNVAPGSPAYKAGLAVSDKVIAVNSFALNNDLSEWLNYFIEEEMELTVSASSIIKRIKLKLDKKEVYYKNYLLSPLKEADESQKINFNLWSKNKF